MGIFGSFLILFLYVSVLHGLQSFPKVLKSFQPSSSSIFLHSTILQTQTEKDTLNKQSTLSTNNFYHLKQLQDRCKKISSQESQYMLSFYTDTLKCFQIFPNISTSRVSITSTCFSVTTALENPSHWNNILKWEHSAQKADNQINIKDIVTSLYNSSWTFDAFQNPTLITTLCRLHAIDINHPKIVQSIDQLLEQRSKLSLHRVQPYSTYLRYRNVQALMTLVETGFIPVHIQGSNKIGYALERANLVGFDELCRQLAFFNSGDSVQFDILTLTFSLLIYYETSQNLFLQSYAKGVIPTTNLKLVISALEIVFASQTADGTWRKGEPIFARGVTGTGMGVSSGSSSSSSSSSSSAFSREVGNSFVFFMDLIGSVVGSLSRNHAHLLQPYISNLERCITWTESNVLEVCVVDMI